MSDSPNVAVTVDTSLLEPSGDAVNPASETVHSPEAARPDSPQADSPTTDKEPTVSELQEQLSREKARADGAEKARREFEGRARKSMAEAERMRQETLQSVERDIANLQAHMNDKIANQELVTQAELDRRDALIEQRLTLRQNNVAQAEHEQRRVEYANKLRDQAIGVGMDEDQYQQFLLRHSVPDATGAPQPFGNYQSPEAAYEAAMAFLHYETRDKYEQNVRQSETQKADDLRKKQLRSALPGGSPPKPTTPATPQDSYKEAIAQAGVISNPDSWF